MSAQSDLERRIADFYANEPQPRAPDRVLGEALATIESTPQRRVLALAPWRFRRMSFYTKLAVAAVAIVAVTTVTVIGLLPRADGPGGPTPTMSPIPSASPTPSASPNPSVAAVKPLPEGGRELALGRYRLLVPGSEVAVELTIAEGDWTGNGWYISDPLRSVSFWTVDDVFADACLQSLPAQKLGPTVDDLVSALDAQAGTDMTRFFNPIVGGYNSSRVVMRPSEGIETTCGGDLLALWQDLDQESPIRSIAMTASPAGQEDVIWIVDVDGTRVVIVGYYDESDGGQFESILQIIDSVEFVTG